MSVLNKNFILHQHIPKQRKTKMITHETFRGLLNDLCQSLESDDIVKKQNLTIQRIGQSVYIQTPEDDKSKLSLNQLQLSVNRGWVGDSLKWGIKWEHQSPCVFGYYCTGVHGFSQIQETNLESLISTTKQILTENKCHL